MSDVVPCARCHKPITISRGKWREVWETHGSKAVKVRVCRICAHKDAGTIPAPAPAPAHTATRVVADVETQKENAMAKRKPKYQPRKCSKCGSSYTPLGARGDLCPACRKSKKGSKRGNARKVVRAKPAATPRRATPKTEGGLLANRIRQIVDAKIEECLEGVLDRLEPQISALVRGELEKQLR